MSIESNQYLLDTFKKNRSGVSAGVFSICSANPFVIKAGLREALKRNAYVLIEATCNQVNQFGGYTGKTPLDFRQYIESIAYSEDFDLERIILGGDHLGPYPWRHLPANLAMDHAEQMVKEYATVGFQKFHLDTSMRCADDPRDSPLSNETIALRAVRLCKGIEKQLSATCATVKPVYVIGTEVPVPGGQQDVEETVQVTKVEDVDETICVHRKAFLKEGLESTWERVIAVVVQPGVEFNENKIYDYIDNKAGMLKSYIETVENMVYEAHSTDYQLLDNLKKLVRDHFAILKVGPALTFAYREALIGLCHIEEQLFNVGKITNPSNLLNVISRILTENPEHWKNYLPENEDLELAKIYSYSDRIRYYWPNEMISASVHILIENLIHTTIPLPIIKQYFPLEYEEIRGGVLKSDPNDLINEHIIQEIQKYSLACNP
jgi:D-tagatose-1,6-bisphosphate aldolase subunit GatZ/KbaZ